MTFGSADKYREPSAVSESWGYNFWPRARIKICVFVQHHAVESQTAQGFVIISPEQSDLCPIRVIDPQFRRVGLGPVIHDRSRSIQEIIPRHSLGLGVGRSNVGKPGT